MRLSQLEKEKCQSQRLPGEGEESHNSQASTNISQLLFKAEKGHFKVTRLSFLPSYGGVTGISKPMVSNIPSAIREQGEAPQLLQHFCLCLWFLKKLSNVSMIKALRTVVFDRVLSFFLLLPQSHLHSTRVTVPKSLQFMKLRGQTPAQVFSALKGTMFLSIFKKTFLHLDCKMSALFFLFYETWILLCVPPAASDSRSARTSSIALYTSSSGTLPLFLLQLWSTEVSPQPPAHWHEPSVTNPGELTFKSGYASTEIISLI